MNFYYKNTILKVENLSVEIEGRKIIENINLEEKDIIRENTTQGQMIAIVGRSGRGKSTFFKALTGLRKPTTGKVLFPEHDSENLVEVKEGDVGFVDQKYTLFRHLSIYNQLILAAQKGNITKAEIANKVDSLLVDWGLEKIKHQYPNQCSGGQRQRVAILTQVLSSGNFIVLDEPFSGLDVGNVEDVKNILRYLNSTNELNTIIFSTHDIELAVELADKIYVIGFKNPDTHVGSIVDSFCLKEMGIAWKPYSEKHIELVHRIKKSILES